MPESRGWKLFWALPALTALLLLVHGGGVVERVYLPVAVLIGFYLCLKFPRVYLAFAVQVITISALANRIAGSQSVFRGKSPMLAAPFLVVAMGAVRMWRARPPERCRWCLRCPCWRSFMAQASRSSAGIFA